MIAKGLVTGALPALGQLQTPATIADGARLSKEFRDRRAREAVICPELSGQLIYG
jgi:hypothetical protein